MSVDLAAAAVGAGAALLGAAVAGGASLVVERSRGRSAAAAQRRNDLLAACAEFSASIALIRSYSYRVATDQGVDPQIDAKIEEAVDRARVGCERLRLLVQSRNTQKAAREALRHVYAVWKEARDGSDPRAADYPGMSPSRRLRGALTTLYVGVRRETGMPTPEDVFVDLD